MPHFRRYGGLITAPAKRGRVTVFAAIFGAALIAAVVVLGDIARVAVATCGETRGETLAIAGAGCGRAFGMDGRSGVVLDVVVVTVVVVTRKVVRRLEVTTAGVAAAERSWGDATPTVMNAGWRRAQASACALVSKKRSITIALRSAAERPARRAARRVRTADPVSTATSVLSAIRTSLPYGMQRGSTAQCPFFKRVPDAAMCLRVQESAPEPPLAQ